MHDADFELSTNDVIVDAIFGIGSAHSSFSLHLFSFHPFLTLSVYVFIFLSPSHRLSRAINKEPYLSLIRQINSARDASKSFVFAVDIPSGILAGTGKVLLTIVIASSSSTIITDMCPLHYLSRLLGLLSRQTPRARLLLSSKDC